jgi:hypothetical protein
MSKENHRFTLIIVINHGWAQIPPDNFGILRAVILGSSMEVFQQQDYKTMVYEIAVIIIRWGVKTKKSV